MKSTDLIGRRVQLVVHDMPCTCRLDGHEPLTETIAGVIEKFIEMPGGAIGLLIADDGRRIAFDAGPDLGHGRVSIEVSA